MRPYTHTWLLLGAIAAALAPPARAAAANAADDAFEKRLEDIDRRSARVTDLSATFEQQKFTALLRKPLNSSGLVRVKGSVSRWDTKKPDHAVLHSDGREIRMYYPRQKVVEVYPIDRRMSEVAASPLPRLAALRQHFTIEPGEAEKGGGAGEELLPLRLVPRGEFLKEHVDEVRVVLDVAGAFVLRVEVLDADGDRTVIRFSDVKLNARLKDGDLSLNLPAGTRISRPLRGATDTGGGGGARQ